MKRILAAVLSVSLLLPAALTGCGKSAAHDIASIESYQALPFVTEAEIEAIERLKAENESFSYGHLLETESFRLPDGSFAGFSIEVCALFSELFDIEFVPEYCEDWESLINRLDAQTIDFTGCLTHTKQRAERYAMSYPLGGHDLGIFMNKDHPEIKSDAELAGLTIGFIRGAATKELILSAYGGLIARSMDVQGVEGAAELLRTGEIDAVIVDSTMEPQFEAYDFIRAGKLFRPVFTQVSISTGNPDLAPVISVINKYLDAGGFSEISALYDEGDIAYKKNKLLTSLTDEERAYLAALEASGGAIPILLEHDNYPFSFYNKQEKKFEGAAVDVLGEVCRLTGLRFKNTTTPTTAWTDMLADLKSGRASLISHLVYSDERAKSYIWNTVPYSVDHYVLISKAGVPQVKSYDIPTLRTGVFRGSIYEDIYRDWFPDSVNLFIFDSASESFGALERGDIDFVLGADYTLLSQVNYREKSGYVVNYRFDATLSSAFGFHQNEAVLRSIVDKALSQIELEPISDYWNSRVFDYSSKMAQQTMLYISASAVFLLFALAAVSFLLFKNKRLTESLRVRTVTLSDARRSLQTILDTVPLPIGILDKATQRIVYGNKVFLDTMELSSPEELYALRGIDIFAPDQPDGAEPRELGRLFSDKEGEITREVRFISASRKTIDVRMHVRWSDYKGRRSAIAIMVDLTAEKEHARILLAAAEHEKEANQAKSMFLANMSHEIRTPMNGIIGLTDLLLSENISGRQLQYVKDIKTSSESLLGIINDILDISKVSAGKLQIVPVDVDLSLMLDNIVSMIGFSARVKGLNFLADIRVASPEYVRLDDVRVRQIIINLLSNSIKFTKEGYVKLSVWIEGESIVFEVKDTGIGIKKENLANIYGAFEQVDMLKNRAIKGTGLGLSITKSLVELMGGSIRVESEYGAGTVFTVLIPYEAGDAANIQRPDTEFAYLSAPEARVLLVDDIIINLTVGAGMLRLCGITANVAASGREAIELIKKQDYDLVFMDHMMPEMDGIEATKRIRALGEKYRRLPIVALTANAMNESRDLLLESGMDDFIAKPIDKGAFMAVLRKWLPPEKVEEGTHRDSAAEPEAYTEALDAAARLRGLSIEQALSRVGGLQDVLEASLKQAALSIDDRLKKMDGALSGGDLTGFAFEAHGLKGMLANIGATYDSEFAAQLESAAKAGDLQLCAGKFSAFAGEIEGLSQGLKDIFLKTADDDRPPGDKDLLARKVAEAIEFLEGFESAEAVACLQELDRYSFGEKISGLLREAEYMVEAFKYEAAISALKGISE